MYDKHLDSEFLEGLPIGFRRGGDQMVHVQSQNLALAKTARRYETATGRPIQFILARVADPSPLDLPAVGKRVHSAAVRDAEVQKLVGMLLDDRHGFWTGMEEAKLAAWIDRNARQCAQGIIEQAALSRHPASEVTAVLLDELEKTESTVGQHHFRFAGRAKTLGNLLRRSSHVTTVTGSMKLRCDRFGRVLTLAYEVAQREDRKVK